MNESVRELTPGRRVALGESTHVTRVLPTLGRRMVGPWCFIDSYGPDDISTQPGMQVAPHPHTGLQTVSWLRAGEVLHHDSVGSTATIRPGELGLMTSGHGIAHSEQSPDPHPTFLHGLQLWTALPAEHRNTAPHFEHHKDLPHVTAPGLNATVVMGTLDTTTSPGTAYSPIVGADLSLEENASVRLPLHPDFEYAVVATEPGAVVDGVELPLGALLYLGANRTELPLRATTSTNLMLLGGTPFEEDIVMWWNFVGRTHEDIVQARTDWVEGDRFGTVNSFGGARLPAPELPATPLKPRGPKRG